MPGDVLKKLFKPKSIKTTYGLLDNLKEKDMTLKQWLDFKMVCECPKSIDRTCKNFECDFNCRLLHKMINESESDAKHSK